MNKLKSKRLFSEGELGIYMIPIIMFIVLSFASPTFFTGQNVINLLLQVSVVGILALGQTYAIITGGIDLSVSSLISLVGCVSIGLYAEIGLLPSLIISLAIGILVGFVNGIIIAKLRIEAFIVTLAMTSILQSIVLLYTGGYPKFIEPSLENPAYGEDFLYIGGGKVFDWLPFSFLLMLISAIILSILLKNTRLGRYIMAVGCNKDTARLSGIKVDKVHTIAYVICSLMGALAAVVYASRIGTGLPNMGTGYELDSVAAVVVGGTALSGGKGSITRTVAGAFIFTILANGLNLLGVSASYQYMAVGVIILLAVILNQLNQDKRIKRVG